MVRIIGCEKRSNKDNEPFMVLLLQGDLVLVQSAETKRFYATAKRSSIPSTFSEDEAKALIGRDIPGRIAKVSCETYEYTLPESGEVITLSHRWEYLPDEIAATPLRAVMGGLAA